MSLSALALRHLRRTLPRTLIMVLGLALGAAAVAALLVVASAMEDSLAAALRAGGVTARVTPAEEARTPGYSAFGSGPVAPGAATLLPVGSLAGLGPVLSSDTIVAPELLALESGPDGTEALVVGVDWPAELALRQYWTIQGAAPAADGEVLLGAHLARLWGLGPSRTLRLFGRDYLVSGVLAETGQEEDGLAFTGLSELQARTGRPGALTH